MTTPSGMIKMSDVNTELGRTYNQVISLGSDGQVIALSRNFPSVISPAADMQDLQNRSALPTITNGNQDYSGLVQYDTDGVSYFPSGFYGYGLATRSAGNPWFQDDGQGGYIQHNIGGGMNLPGGTIVVTGGAKSATINFSVTLACSSHDLVRTIIFCSDGRQIANTLQDVNTLVLPAPNYKTTTASDAIGRYPATLAYNVFVGVQYNGDYDYSRWNDAVLYFTASFGGYTE